MSEAGPDGSGAVSRPSKNNRQGCSEGGERPDPVEPTDVPGGAGLRPLSVRDGTALREELVLDVTDRKKSVPWYSALNEWREWMADYRQMHIEYEGPNGETSRTRLENSYQPEYGKRYYAKLKDLERGIERTYKSLTTVMLTFSASHENRDGQPRSPADHMREIAEGWNTARKQLHQALSGLNWEYARVWEPHEDGYGHLHVGVFVEVDLLSPERFRPVMGSYVSRVKAAGPEAHELEEAVSVNDEVENLGSYISEYIGIFGDDPLERPISEQMFYAVTWGTQTRRLDFSNGAQEIIKGEEFRRETGLRPKDRGSGSEGAESDAEPEEGPGWGVRSICTVRKGSPEYADPTSGGVKMEKIDGVPGADQPRDMGPPD